MEAENSVNLWETPLLAGNTQPKGLFQMGNLSNESSSEDLFVKKIIGRDCHIGIGSLVNVSFSLVLRGGESLRFWKA